MKYEVSLKYAYLASSASFRIMKPTGEIITNLTVQELEDMLAIHAATLREKHTSEYHGYSGPTDEDLS